MAETFRKSKIEHFVERLRQRKETLKSQLDESDYKEISDFLRGQMSATDMILKELQAEFEISSEPERVNPASKMRHLSER
ncbi:hypothetical protein [Paenibacillus sp. A14]|uniref:hypothetical protein n=1 Tax=Paenibacillus sp. A14 TaxID=3119820 RepID=UPI002FDFFDC2